MRFSQTFGSVLLPRFKFGPQDTPVNLSEDALKCTALSIKTSDRPNFEVWRLQPQPRKGEAEKEATHTTGKRTAARRLPSALRNQPRSSEILN